MSLNENWLGDYLIGQETGVNVSGSAEGAWGAAAHQPPKEWKLPSTEESNEKKVICTELVRQGKLERKDYLLGAQYVQEFLTPEHEADYHWWACVVVRRMRQSSRWTKFFEFLAKSRADSIAYHYGDRSRRNLMGTLLCSVGEPICLIIGRHVGDQNWATLYNNRGISSQSA